MNRYNTCRAEQDDGILYFFLSEAQSGFSHFAEHTYVTSGITVEKIQIFVGFNRPFVARALGGGSHNR